MWVASPSSYDPYSFFLKYLVKMSATSLNHNTCTGCKSGEIASAFCQDCSHFLCSNCKMAHQFMHCFEGHRVQEIQTNSISPPSLNVASKTCNCLQHRQQALRFFCLSCNLAICRECTLVDHAAPAHQYEPIQEVSLHHRSSFLSKKFGQKPDLMPGHDSVKLASISFKWMR